MRFSKETEDLIADFRGLPREVSHASKREPAQLHSVLDYLNERYQLEQPTPERVLVENWTHIFGEKLAERCAPVRIRDERTLVVTVSNQTLRSELQFRKRAILAKIRKLDRCGHIRDIALRG